MPRGAAAARTGVSPSAADYLVLRLSGRAAASWRKCARLPGFGEQFLQGPLWRTISPAYKPRFLSTSPLRIMSRILITSALPYAAGAKHLGNLAGSMLPADVYARFQRSRGRET